MLKRLLFLCFILILGAGIFAYKNGLRLHNYKDFFSEIPSGSGKEKQASAEEEKTELPKPEAKTEEAAKLTQKHELQALPENPFAIIDEYARNCPSYEASDIKTLASYLERKAATDLEKSRAIYVWITDNIRYDDDAFNVGSYGDYSAEAVLKTRKAVCEGFSNLFLALGQEMGIAIEKVSGYAKGYGYSGRRKIKASNHAWNVIKINGNWRIFDSTWGQGNGKSVNGKLVTKKEFEAYWFNVDPYEAIFSHLPENEKFSFVQPQLTLNQYNRFPAIDEGYFKLGYSGKDTYLKVYSDVHSEFPKCLKQNTYIEMVTAPDLKKIYRNQPCDFDFYVPRGLSMAAIDSKNNWTYFEQNRGRFRLNYIPRENGELHIGVQHENSGQSFETILIYFISEPLNSIK